MYRITYNKRFEKSFAKLTQIEQKKVVKVIQTLAQNPFTNSNIRNISGVKQNAYRMRIGRWRVLYLIITKKQIIELVDLFMKKNKSDYKDIK